MRHFKRYLCIALALITLSTFSPELCEITGLMKAIAVDSSDAQVLNTENIESNFSFPEQLRALTIVPGKDFLKDINQSAETTTNEIKKIVDNIGNNELNAIIIETNYENKAYYSSNAEISVEENALKELISYAKKNYLYVYVDFDINFVLNECDSTNLEEKINYLTHISHKFAREYMCDGIILDGYYSSNNIENYNYYMENGSGIGFENWLLENGSYVFSLVSKSIHKTDNSIPVGISISNMWANSSTNENGSNTKDDFEALTDGFSDTVKYIENEYADFLMIDVGTSLTDNNIPLKTATEWWSNVAKTSDIPLFVMHAYDKIGTNAQGYSMDDQVIKQILAIEKLPKYSGSAFNSYSAFFSKTEATDALIKFYQDSLDLEALFSELKLNSPKQTTFTTYEPTVAFQGTFDKNFDITLNGKPLKLNEAGYFYYNMPLEIGLNVFKLENKGKVVIYRITRKIKVLKSVTPTSQMIVEGGSSIPVTAVAYKGSTVTATLNGKTINLKEIDGGTEDMNIGNAYAIFSGTFLAPQGTTLDKNIGNIVFNANYQNKNHESITGSNIIINGLPEGILPQKLLKITDSNGAKIFYDTSVSNYKYPIPKTRLPIGTLDYYKDTVELYGETYYVTQSGRRILASSATLIDGKTFGENKVEFQEGFVENYDTYLKFKVDNNVPIDISSSPCKYYTGSHGNFYVDYAATSITITFDYTVESTNEVILPENSLFTSAKWSDGVDANGRKQKKLTLTLRKTGGYSGATPSYSDGILTLKFNGHPSTLSGAVIAIDPGHGFTENGNDPGAIGHVTERDINLAVAKLVEQKLIDAGATVHRLKTESQTYKTEDRANVVRQYNPDMFLSIHCNSAGPNSAGSEAFHFHPFSQPLAKYMANNISSALKTANRGTKYNEFYVTLQQEFPSTLIELGFVSNYNEAMKLGNKKYQNAIADEIVAGITQYLKNN